MIGVPNGNAKILKNGDKFKDSESQRINVLLFIVKTSVLKNNNEVKNNTLYNGNFY